MSESNGSARSSPKTKRAHAGSSRKKASHAAGNGVQAVLASLERHGTRLPREGLARYIQ